MSRAGARCSAYPLRPTPYALPPCLYIPAMDLRSLLMLTMTRGLGPTLIGRLVETFGSPDAALDAVRATADSWAGVRGISARGANEARTFITGGEASDAAERELDECERLGVRLMAMDDPAYPAPLRHVPDPPPLLWVRGEMREEDALAVAMVGSRKCSLYGREQSARFAAGLAQAGLCIVSGGAYGIDHAAHDAALRVRGRTIAVIGSGLSRPYPREHKGMFDAISDGPPSHGAVLSELPLHTPPAAEHFPRRNRIISGLSLGTLVIEAASRSGALITARLCVEEHGRELMALPGRVDSSQSAGCHKMIREGWATLVTDVGDVIDCLGEAGRLLREGAAEADREAGVGASTPSDTPLLDSTLSEDGRRIVAAMDGEPRTLDEIVSLSELPAQRVQAELTMLEIRGRVRREGGRFVARG